MPRNRREEWDAALGILVVFALVAVMLAVSAPVWAYVAALVALVALGLVSRLREPKGPPE